MTVRKKLIMGVVAVLTVLTSLFMWDITTRQRKVLVDFELDHTLALATTLATSSANWLLAGDVAGLQELIEVQRSYPELSFAMLASIEGRVLAHTDKKMIGLRVIDLPEHSENTVLYQNKKLIDVAVPVVLNENQVGWARVGIAMESTEQQLAKILRKGVIYALLTISFGAAVAWFLGQQLTRRLYIFQDTIDQVKTGKRDFRISLGGSDEITCLADEFNQMLDTLSQREKELEQANSTLEDTVAERTQQLEESLAMVRSRESELRTAQQVAKIGSWSMYLVENRFSLSDETFNIFGIDKGTETHWKQFLLYVYPEDRRMVINGWEEALENGTREIEHRIIVDEQIRWVHDRIEILYSKEGEPVQAIGTVQDITPLKENILALAQSEKRLRAIIDASPVPSTLQDSEHRILYTNNAFLRTFGYNREEVETLADRQDMISQVYSDHHMSKRMRKEWENRLERNRQGDAFEPMELRVQCKNHSVRTVLAEASHLEGQEDGLYLVTFFDVTELNSLISRMKNLFDTASDGIHILDSTGGIYEFSNSFSRMLGYTREEMQMLSLTDWDVSLVEEKVVSSINNLMEHPHSFERRFRRKDGTVLDVEINAQRIELDGRSYLYAAARDISERKATEFKIRQLAEIVESSQDAIFSETLDGVITSWNRGAERLFGYIDEEVLGHNIDFLLPEGSKGENLSNLETIRKGEEVTNYETRRVHKNGKLFDVSVSVSPVYDENDEVVGASKIIRDISRLKESEERFRALFVESPDAFLLVEIESPSTIFDCNCAAEKLLLGRREQIIGLTMVQMSPPVQPDGRESAMAIAELEEEIAERGSHRFEWLHRRFDGEGIWIDVSVVMIRLLGRQVFLVSWRDISEKKKTDLQLQETANLLEVATGAVEMGIWVWDINEEKMSWDDRMYDLYDIPPVARGRQIGFDFWKSCIHHDDVAQVERQMREYARERGEFATVFRIMLSGGKIRFIEAAARLEPEAKDGRVRLIGTSRDVTFDKENEQRLAESEAQFRQIFEGNDSVMLIIDPNTHTIFAANQAAVKFYGYSEDELNGMTLERLGDKTFDDLGEHIARAVAGRLRYFTLKQTLASDAVRDVELYMTPLQFGGCVRLFTICHDVTDRVRAQLDLQKANRKIVERSALLQHILDTVSVGVLLVDRDGRISLANKRAAEMFLRTVEELVGLEYLELVHPEEGEVSRGQLTAMLDHELQFVDNERLFIRGDGSAFWGRVVGQAFYLSGSGMVGILGSIADVTLQKNAEEQLIKARDAAETANRAKSEFLANMSHEIRTPLNGVIGLAHLMRHTPLNPRQEDYLSKIDSSSKALLGILNDILDYSKIDAGYLELEENSFYLDDLLSGISDLFSVLAEEKDLEFLFYVKPDVPPQLQGDLLRLRQVLSNLVGNAMKFTEQGEILVTISILEQEGDDIQLNFAVRDTGLGISPEDQQRLFQAFQQADGSTTRRFGGTGLGLSISKKIVDLMGGEIGVTSALGEGSTFSFTIPMKIKPDTELLRDPANLRGMRVLVVDDQSSSLLIMEQILDSWGFHVTTACSADEALREIERTVVKQEPFELLLLDSKMPGMDGFALAGEVHDRSAKANWPELPMVIMVTARGQDQARNGAKTSLFDAILDKPVTSSHLFDVIVDIQYGRKARPEKERPLEREPGRVVAGPVPGTKILLVEDNKVNQQVALELLVDFGFVVSVANDGLEALDSIGRERFAAVLLDLQMPRMDGYETARRIREVDSEKELPLIAMTAAALLQDKNACLAAGMNDHISKPIDPAVLAATLQKWIPWRAPRANNRIKAVTDGQRELGAPFALSGFELRETVARMAGNWHALRKALVVFHDEFSGLAISLTKMLVDTQYEKAAGIVHSIKGASGNVGAVELYLAATNLETAIKSGSSNGLDQFLDAYEKVMQALDGLIADDGPSTLLDVTKAGEVTESFKELRNILTQQRIVPENMLSELKGLLSLLPDSHLFGRLQRQIDSFDYNMALETIAAIEKALSVDSKA